jgi:hypothetical protein
MTDITKIKPEETLSIGADTSTIITPIVPTIPTVSTSLPPTTYKPYVPPVRTDTSKMPLLDPKTLPQSAFWDVLGTALTMRRDYGTSTESSFVAWLSRYLGGADYIDAAGNIYFDRRTDDKHRTMFCAHTDTVHSSGGPNKVHIDGKFWRASENSALGADDGAGIAILAHLMEHQVPALYVFFRGEERGGIGSSHAVKELPHMFVNLDRAIAFDRADYYDVITYQSGGVCCSDEFAQALCDALATDDLWYLPCDGGVYTDTAEFTGIIPECTNISVGYKHQHGDREQQDIEFLQQLAGQAVLIKWDELPTKRDPRPKSRYKYTYGGSTSGKANKASKSYSEYYGAYDTDDRTLNSGYYGDEFGKLTSSNDEEVPPRDPFTLDGDEDESESAPALDLELEALCDAIDSARRGRSFDLIELMAQTVYPEDPDVARRMVDIFKLNSNVYDAAEIMIDQGWEAEPILTEMFSTVSRET